MENLIKKAIEGEYLLLSIPYKEVVYESKWLVCTLKSEYVKAQGTTTKEIAVASIFIDPLFWQALSNSFNDTEWKFDEKAESRIRFWERDVWKSVALRFHEINLTEGWEKAVEWLNSLIK